MKRVSSWLVLPTLLAITLIAPARSQETPLAAPLQVTGQSGGPQQSSCGYISAAPNQTIKVTEAFTSLNIQVQSTGDYTLFLTGPGGFSECVLAHDFDGGVIQSPGVLNQGTYQIYVGDRNGASHPFTLSISQ
jgi:hypothetical protein